MSALKEAEERRRSDKRKDEEPRRDQPILQCLADVEAVEIQWLWPDRIPSGRLSLICGLPGVGKSFLTMSLVAHVSTGLKFPDGSPCPLGSTLILAAEDDAADTIRPRLNAHGADASKIHCLKGVQKEQGDGTRDERAFLLSNMAILDEALKSQPDFKLVIIDPIGSYLGSNLDAHRDNDVRSALTPLARLAERFQVAVVLVAHPRKGSSDYADDTILGSRAFSGIARAIWHVTHDPNNPTRRLFVPGKSNLAKQSTGFSFSIDGSPARVIWDEHPVHQSADDVMNQLSRNNNEKRKPGPKPTQREEAITWLEERLSGGPRTVAELKVAAESAGHQWRTVLRAAGELKVERIRDGFGGSVMWSLARMTGTSAICHLGTNEESSKNREVPCRVESYVPNSDDLARMAGIDLRAG